MKLEDKTIEQITAIFDKEIAELEEEIKHAAEDALAAAKAEAPEAPAAEAVAEAEVADEDAEPATEPQAAEQESGPAEEPQAATPASSGNAKAALSAIGYILAIAAICVLSVLCMNLLDKQLQSMKPEIPQDLPQSNLAASLQTYTAKEVIAKEGIKQPTLEQIYTMDLRTPSGATEADLKKVTKAGLVGLEDTFLAAEKKYGVNAIFLMSIASLESAHGTMMYRPNNMFGYGGKSYASKEACIMDVAYGLSSRYLKPGGSLYGGSPTLKGVNKRYAANPQWYAKVGKYMKSYYDVIAPYHNQTLNKIK